jgi:hypothetical protein
MSPDLKSLVDHRLLQIRASSFPGYRDIAGYEDGALPASRAS